MSNLCTYCGAEAVKTHEGCEIRAARERATLRAQIAARIYAENFADLTHEGAVQEADALLRALDA